MSRAAALRLGIPIVIVVLGALGGVSLDPYYSYVLGVWCTYSVACIGLMLAVGWVGEISVGHAGVMAVAAYSAAFLTKGDVVTGLALGAVVGLGAGFVLGLPSLRLRGFGLAIVTLVFGEIVRVGISNTQALGGTQGRPTPALTLFGEPAGLSTAVVVAAAVLGIGLIIVGLLRDSTFGRAWRAVRDNEPLARAFGNNPPFLRLTAFVISGAYCGVAGVLLSWLIKYISPSGFDLWLSIYLLAIVVIGGRDETYGPLLGAAILVFGPELLRVTREVQGVAFGLGVLLVVWFMPQGLAAVIAEPVRKRLRARARLTNPARKSAA
jgi:branched-chain amino acid transport system permease protein